MVACKFRADATCTEDTAGLWSGFGCGAQRGTVVTDKQVEGSVLHSPPPFFSLRKQRRPGAQELRTKKGRYHRVTGVTDGWPRMCGRDARPPWRVDRDDCLNSVGKSSHVHN